MNDATLFPNREFSRPLAVTMEDGLEEYFIHNIIDECRCGHGYHYLVWWVGYGAEENHWLKGADLKDTEVLNIWLAKHRTGMDFISTILLLPQPAGSFPTGFWCTCAVHCNYCFLFITPLPQLFSLLFFDFIFQEGGGCNPITWLRIVIPYLRCHPIVLYKDPLRVLLLISLFPHHLSLSLSLSLRVTSNIFRSYSFRVS